MIVPINSWRGTGCEGFRSDLHLSLILDALNRSERDRRGVEVVPNIATEHYPDSTAPGVSWRQHLLWVALLIAVLVIGWLVWDRLESESLAQPAPAVETPSPASQPRPAVTIAVPERASTQASPGNAQPTTPPAVRTIQASEPTAASADVANLYSKAPVRESMPAVARTEPEIPTQAAARPQPTAISPEPVREENLDIEALVVRAENELQNARLEEHSAPFLSDLSQQKKDTIPTLMYSRHEFSSDEALSSVTINGTQLKKGGRVAGVRVVEILPDSLVLSYQGSEFRLRALNSWINL